MDEIKTISNIEFNVINSQHPFQRALLVKDYYLTVILYLIKDVEGIYFKGGTAINKIILEHARLSEDLDFALTKNQKKVKEEVSKALISSRFVRDIKEGKEVEGFLRLIVKCRSELGDSEVFIDLNDREKLLLPTEMHNVPHFYAPFIPKFSVKTVAKEEMVADKVAATIGRNKPRDHYDVYTLLKKGMLVNMELAKMKCIEAGDEFSIIKMFNKAKTLKNRWDKDMIFLISEPITFQEIIKFLADYFKLKEIKENSKDAK